MTDASGDLSASSSLSCGCRGALDCGDDASTVSFEARSSGSKPRVTKAETEATDYLCSHRVPELFNFLIGHLVADQPEDPSAYLFDLLDKCLLFRSGLVEPPLLFAPRHIESIYRSLDPEELGYITKGQYATGMRTLGICDFNPDPMMCGCQCDPTRVNKETFLQEAKNCLTRKLRRMITVPRVCF